MEQIIRSFIELFSVSTLRYFVVAGIPFFICYKVLHKRLNKSKIQKRDAVVKDFLREMVHSIKTTIVLTVIGCIILFTPFKNFTLIYTSISDFPLWWLPVSIALALIVHDTYFYWMHRFLHMPVIFPYAHLVHHKSTNPSPWASYSFHIAEAFTEGAVLFIIVMIIPMNLVSIILFVILAFMINVYGHLGYELAPIRLRKTFLFEIMNTSVYHNLHHSKFKGNYGLYFRFWDRLMGTEHPDYVKEYDRIQQNRLQMD